MNTYTLDPFALFFICGVWFMLGWMWGRRR